MIRVHPALIPLPSIGASVILLALMAPAAQATTPPSTPGWSLTLARTATLHNAGSRFTIGVTYSCPVYATEPHGPVGELVQGKARAYLRQQQNLTCDGASHRVTFTGVSGNGSTRMHPGRAQVSAQIYWYQGPQEANSSRGITLQPR